MKKIVIILSVLGLIVSSCKQTAKKEAQAEVVNNGNTTEISNVVKEKDLFDYKTLPSEWALLSYTGGKEKYVICKGEEKALTIEGCKLVYWGNQYDILESYKIGDTIVINAKMPNKDMREFNFFWSDKDKGIARWEANDEPLGSSGLFVVTKKISQFPIVECYGPDNEVE